MAKIEIFQFCIEYCPTTLWVKISVEMALSLTVLIFFQFHIEYIFRGYVKIFVSIVSVLGTLTGVAITSLELWKMLKYFLW